MQGLGTAETGYLWKDRWLGSPNLPLEELGEPLLAHRKGLWLPCHHLPGVLSAQPTSHGASRSLIERWIPDRQTIAYCMRHTWWGEPA